MNQPASTVYIRNARLAGDDKPRLICLREGRIASISPAAEGQVGSSADALEINAQGRLALPAMTDLYSRLREPGQTRKGTIARECRAALAAGFTQLVCAPDTSPAIDSVATVELICHRAQAAGAARVLPLAALTVGLDGEQLSELATLQAAGCPAASQADRPLQSSTVLYSAMEYAASFNLPLFMTARDAQIGAGGCAHSGAMATRLGLPGIPVAAETVDLARLLELCSETGCQLHISRISSARGVKMIAAAKQQGLPVSCDVGLHHLFFIDEQLAGYDASFHSAVPFRSRADREALRQGVVDGTIDAICTDHAPQDRDAGLAPFPATEPGLSAYHWALPLILQLPSMLRVSLQQVMACLTDAPRRILGSGEHGGLQAGAQADFFLLAEDRTVEPISLEATEPGQNHPLARHAAHELELPALHGRVTHVFTDDRVHSLGPRD